MSSDDLFINLFALLNIALVCFDVMLLLCIVLPARILQAMRLDSLADAFVPLAIPLALVIAAIAIAGSLYLSEIKHFNPCFLCWVQRGFIYPQVVYIGLYLWKRFRVAKIASIASAVIGLCISTYHYFIEWFPSNETSLCVANGGQSCATIWFRQFGFVTIPFMAIMVSLSILLLFAFVRRQDNRNVRKVN